MTEHAHNQSYANIGKHLVENGEWHTYNDEVSIHDNGEPFARISLKLPYDADLSCNGTRLKALESLLEAEK